MQLSGPPKFYKSTKVVRNCVAYELNRTATRVIFTLHMSTQHSWDMATEDWDALPEGIQIATNY